MLLSMTGFAVRSTTLTLDGVPAILTVTIKTLNSRFFESTCKLPYAFLNLETQIIKILKNKLCRGHAYCTIHVSGAPDFATRITPCMKTIASYITAMNLIKKEHAIEQPILLDHIIRMQNIFESTESQLSSEIVQAILSAVECTSDLVIQERIQEGSVLVQDIQYQISVMQQEMELIEAESKIVFERQKEKVQKLAQEIAAEEVSTENRKSNVYTLLDKMDINEEVIRFKAHLHNLTSHIKKPIVFDVQASDVSNMVQKGKQLDFILQEMSREINTMSAKCSDARIASSAINVKVAVEKIREQAQNIV